MRRRCIYTAFVMMILVVAASAVFADQYDYSTNTYPTAPAQAAPCCPAGQGAGPVLCTPDQYCEPSPCCDVAPPSCGAFCAAGQVPPSWPYNWCDQYWLRPDSNL